MAAPTRGCLARVKGAVVQAYEFQYNPVGYVLKFGPEWAFPQAPGHVFPMAQFNKVGPHEISFTLQLEGMKQRDYNKGQGCQPDIDILESLCAPDIDDPTSGVFVAPPTVILSLGPRVVRGVMLPVVVRITELTPNLYPLYAEADISIRRITKTLLDDLKWIAAQRAKVMGALRQPSPPIDAQYLG